MSLNYPNLRRTTALTVLIIGLAGFACPSVVMANAFQSKTSAPKGAVAAPPVPAIKVVEFDPKEVILSDLVVGHHVAVPVTLHNKTDSPLRIATLTMVDADESTTVVSPGCSAVQLPPGGGCLAVVNITPSERGPILATVVAMHDGPDGGITRLPIKGTVAEPNRRLSSAPFPVNDLVGPSERVAIGEGRAVPLTNTSDVSLHVERAEIIGPAMNYIAVDGSDCTGRELHPGKKCMIKLARTRPAATKGPLPPADLVVVHDGPSRLLMVELDYASTDAKGETSPLGVGVEDKRFIEQLLGSTIKSSGNSLPQPPAQNPVPPPQPLQQVKPHTSDDGAFSLIGISGGTAIFRIGSRCALIRDGGVVSAGGTDWKVDIGPVVVTLKSGSEKRTMRVSEREHAAEH